MELVTLLTLLTRLPEIWSPRLVRANLDVSHGQCFFWGGQCQVESIGCILGAPIGRIGHMVAQWFL
jgi:hypothetical protein